MIKTLEKTTEYDGLELTYGDIPVDTGTPRVFTFTALEQWELDTTEPQDGSDLICEDVLIYEIVMFSEDMTSHKTFLYPNGVPTTDENTEASDVFYECYEYAMENATSDRYDLDEVE